MSSLKQKAEDADFDIIEAKGSEVSEEEETILTVSRRISFSPQSLLSGHILTCVQSVPECERPGPRFMNCP